MSIEVRHLTHCYSEGSVLRTVALDDVSFTISDGEFLGIIGHTGSGKSTLVQHLNGLLKPSSGQILMDGEDLNGEHVNRRALRQRIGLVFQYPEYQLFEETVAKDIAFGPKNQGLSADEIAERVHYAMDCVHLNYDKYAARSPFELSGGQMRRVAIAGVLAMKPIRPDPGRAHRRAGSPRPGQDPHHAGGTACPGECHHHDGFPQHG